MASLFQANHTHIRCRLVTHHGRMDELCPSTCGCCDDAGCRDDPAYQLLGMDGLNCAWAGADGSGARCDLTDGGAT